MKLARFGIVVAGLAVAGAIVFGVTSFGGSAQAAPPPGGGGRAAYEQILAQKLGISVQQLQAAEAAARSQTIDNAVAAGKLTPDQANQLKNHQGGFGFHGHKGGHHRNGTGTPPTTPPGTTRTQ